MGFYEINLGVLVLINAALFLRQQDSKVIAAWNPTRTDVEKDQSEAEVAGKRLEREDPASKGDTFMKTYLVAYLLSAAGDWLQGPHIYAIYRYDKNLPETTTAALYATGFIAGAVSAALVGQLADRYGRRTACLLYCGSYLACCLTMLSDSLLILYLGRICGGISTTLLYSAFETWMITEYNQRGMEANGLSTATIFGAQTTCNSVVAILTGIVGELLVSVFGSRKAPFMFAGFIFVIAAYVISTTWTENYGEVADDDTASTGNSEIPNDSMTEIVSAMQKMWTNKRIFALATASAIFEAMMYLFVFFWSAAIKSTRAKVGITMDPPFGIIFSCFMCAMMAGSLGFTNFSRTHNVASTSYLLQIAMTLASLALLSNIITTSESLAFWGFCVVELCVGLYFPSMSFLKGGIVEDATRGKIYGLMRLPLNAFVVIAHSMAEEGDHHRNNVFLFFGGGLLTAFIIAHQFLD